jgi:electron transfer flavoprotein alpha subunit
MTTDRTRAMVAVVCVRGGELPAGGAECVAECGGTVLLVGEGTAAAAAELRGVATAADALELGPYAAGAWAAAIAPLVADARVVVLPGSPDGRDLAPRLAHALDRPLLAGATQVDRLRATVVRWGGLALEEVRPDRPFVATLQPGVRGVDVHGHAAAHHPEPTVRGLTISQVGTTAAPADATVVEVLPPDVTTMDLAEAPRILGGGAGLDSAERFAQLARVAAVLGASMGATRVITDRHWVGHERQIGTTGVVVAPRTYLAFGISGAVQHTAGLGDPDHVISVNTDPSCPMHAMADLAIVADANAVLDALEARLAAAPAEGSAA